MLTREDILKQNVLPIKRINAFGGEVYIRTMSGIERDSFEQAMVDAQKRGKVNISASLAVRVLCDADGNRLFTDADAEAVGKLSGRDLNEVWKEASRLNGMGAADVQGMEGNSGAGQSAGSTSN